MSASASGGADMTTTRRGLSLIEVIVSTMLVALILAGATRMLAAAVRGEAVAARKLRATMLAEDLMGEIMQQSYAEPDGAPLFGPEAGEGSATAGPRTLWDDVDDYTGWNVSPPQARAGTPLPDVAGYRTAVEVRQVDPADLSTTLADAVDRGVKRVTVTVSFDGQTLATLVGVQTRAWIDMIPQPDNATTTGSLPPGNRPPIAAATGSPLSGSVSVTTIFDATASSDPDGDPLTYAWDFGDGSTGFGARPTHVFTKSGTAPVTRTVRLTVSDVRGAQAAKTLSVTVYPN